MDGQNDGCNLNISQIMENSSLLQGNFIKIKKEIKVNTGIQECVDGLGKAGLLPSCFYP